MPDPMVPPEVNLRGLPWMRLDTARLLDSDLFALSTGDQFKAAVALWCKSWTQQPAASLPNDDRVLAHLSGAGSRWKNVKAIAMRGWVLCEDGRWYHPVVAEQALRAWEERQEFRANIDAGKTRQTRYREERAAMVADLRASGVQLPWNASMSDIRASHAELSARNVDGDDLKRPRNGYGHGLDGMGREGSSKALTTNPRAHRSLQGADDHARALAGEGYSDCSPHDPELLAARAEGITPEELAAAARGRPGKPVAWVVARARGRRADAAERASTGGNGSGPPPQRPVDTAAAKRAAARHRLDDELLKIRQDCDVLGLIGPEERDRRLAEAMAKARPETVPESLQ